MTTILNLKGVAALLVDRSPYYRSLTSQMLRGFGMTTIIACETGADAMEALKASTFDMLLLEADLPDMSAADLISWIRRDQKEPLRFIPILVFSGYTQLRMLSATRDAGANLLLKKPVSGQAIFDRIAWLGRTPRAYIETGNYVGPDRRFKDSKPRDGRYKRETDNNATSSAQA